MVSINVEEGLLDVNENNEINEPLTPLTPEPFPRLLTELFSLQFDTSENTSIWKEKSRIVKFEEVVEDGERWSKPHVSSLKMEAINELKENFKPLVIHDMDVEDYMDFTRKIIEILHNKKGFKGNQLEELSKLFFKKHDYLKGYKMQDTSGGSGSGSLQNTPLIKRKDRGKNEMKNNESTDSSLKKGTLLLSPKRGSAPDILEILDTQKTQLTQNIFLPNKKFMRRLPKNCETANIHTGCVDFIDEPLFIWIRLKEAKMLSKMFTEAMIPTRFVIILIGPKDYNYNMDNGTYYFDMGRVLASMLCDDYFRPTAYMAEDLDDLVDGFRGFLESTTVLPPGQWDEKIRIEPPIKLPPVTLKKNRTRSFSKDCRKHAHTIDDHCDQTLKRTGKLFGGLIQDIKRKSKFYISDFKDSLHPQCLGSIIFIYIAYLSPIITFGGLLGKETENNIAALEGLVAGAINGIIFSLFSGQPLIILGATGPMLVMETIVFKMCKWYGWYFLTVRLWIGIWCFAFILIIVAFDLSAYVIYITRFTEEIFAALICIIFIQQALSKLLLIREKYGVNSVTYSGFNMSGICQCLPIRDERNNSFSYGVNNTFDSNTNNNFTQTTSAIPEYFHNSYYYPGYTTNRLQCGSVNGTVLGDGCNNIPDVFFFSVILFTLTFTIVYGLKMFNNSPFFPSRIRQIISDFAIVIAICITVLLDWYFNLPTPKLEVPNKFTPTSSKRVWLSPFFKEVPWWIVLATSLPAILTTVLIVLDQQITAVIINRNENKLKKGAGYHLDMLVLSIVLLICSFLGLPWYVAATVQSLTHVNSLRMESEGAAPGEKPTFKGIRENRVTMLVVSILIGLSVNLSSLFILIPMPVLYGVFMYMGVSSLKGFQLVDRCLLFFMPHKHQPEYNYIKKVKTWRVHLFTGIQISCLALLWAIKAIKITSIVFPIMILLICVVRKFMEMIFMLKELRELDNLLPKNNKKKGSNKDRKRNFLKKFKKAGNTIDKKELEI